MLKDMEDYNKCKKIQVKKFEDELNMIKTLVFGGDRLNAIKMKFIKETYF
jgi:hypothetical protein